MSIRRQRGVDPGDVVISLDEEIESGIEEQHKPKAPGTGIIDWLLNVPTSHLDPEVVKLTMSFLLHHQGEKDHLKDFVVAATVARRLRAGFVAIIQSSLHRELYLRLAALRDETLYCGKMMNLVAGIGSLFPINLFDAPQAIDWLKDHDPDAHNFLRAGGMTTPATLFEPYLKVGPQVLMANLDVRRPLQDFDVKTARYIIRNHVNLGCPLLLTVSDIEDMDGWEYGAALKGIKTFKIGRF